MKEVLAFLLWLEFPGKHYSEVVQNTLKIQTQKFLASNLEEGQGTAQCKYYTRSGPGHFYLQVCKTWQNIWSNCYQSYIMKNTGACNYFLTLVTRNSAEWTADSNCLPLLSNQNLELSQNSSNREWDIAICHKAKSYSLQLISLFLFFGRPMSFSNTTAALVSFAAMCRQQAVYKTGSVLVLAWISSCSLWEQWWVVSDWRVGATQTNCGCHHLRTTEDIKCTFSAPGLRLGLG